ncbi:hypothetical protein Syun_003439 [Stephania yunnanensis]|uniref:Uncharacterized protein n=1 Tax=Stephania yunnanensis TaxID=152371 RepID=A0AAP0L142_9MAGN
MKRSSTHDTMRYGFPSNPCLQRQWYPGAFSESEQLVFCPQAYCFWFRCNASSQVRFPIPQSTTTGVAGRF